MSFILRELFVPEGRFRGIKSNGNMGRLLLFITSSMALVKPNITPVFKPFELILGFLLKAKCARKISAYASSKKSFLSGLLISLKLGTF